MDKFCVDRLLHRENAMTQTEYEALKLGDLVRHKSGKLYKVSNIQEVQAEDKMHVWASGEILTGEAARKAHDSESFGGSFIPAHGRLVRFTQWQINAKYPQGRYYQAMKEFTADKITRA